MTHFRKSFLMAAVIATAAFAAHAQAPAPLPASGQTSATARADKTERAAQRQARKAEQHAKRMADLKERLQITAAQEGAWTHFVSAMQPPTQPAARPDHAEIERLTTPERIDRMQALQAERQARQNTRNQAIKDFYAQLSPQQRQTFDKLSPGGAESRAYGKKRHGKGGPDRAPHD